MSQPVQIVGEADVRTGYNGTGSEIAQGVIVKLKASPAVKGEIEVSATATDGYWGVAMHDIADGEYGDIQIRGVAFALADTTIAVGARVMATTGGETATATAGNAILGVAVTAGVADTLHEVDLSGPGGGEMPG